MTSSIYKLVATPNAGVITSTTPILQNDIEITSDMVSPGGGGILRLYFTFDFNGAAPIQGQVTLKNNGADFGLLNPDNNGGDISKNGYYRFDIGVQSGDEINLTSDSTINDVPLMRAHLVQFGA